MTQDPNMPQQVYHQAGLIAEPNRYLATMSDDNAAFHAAAELTVGDHAAFKLPLKNASHNDLVAELTLYVPDCLEVEVYADTLASNINGITRIGPNTWKVLLDADADYDTTTDALTVVISIHDQCAAGYYTISGTIRQVGY